MGYRKMALGMLMAGAIATGGVAMASPAWAADPATTEAVSAGCGLKANNPNAGSGRLSGFGSRSGCSDTVTYFWVRVYKVIDWWPDAEKAVKGRNYVQNGGLTATGGCDGRGEYYTHTSTATGAGGDSVESGRAVVC